MTTVTLDGLRTEEELAAAARSSLYGWLAAAFSFPSPELAQGFASGNFRDELQAIAAALPFALPSEDSLSDSGLSYEEMEEQYIRLFDVGPGRPPCPLYEGSHRRGRPEILEDLVRFYEHFGLRHQEGDLPDHLCAELEFMHYLAFKQAAALQAGTDDEPYRLAQRDFLSRRLNRWLPRLLARLEQLNPPPLYLALARLSTEACRRDAGWLKADPKGGP